MFIGHYAPALLLKTRRPSLPLWVLFIGVEVLDYLWSAFILSGVERMRIVPGINESNALDLYDMPWSHSLVATLGWSLLAFTVVAFWRRAQSDRWLAAGAIALAVASHYLLDLVVHVNDLPLVGNDSLKLGFGLWNHKTVALLVETSLVAGSAFALVLAAGRKWLPLGVVMTVVCVGSFFVPTPPGVVPMALSGLALYVLLPLAAWRIELTSGAASARSPG